MARSSSGNWQRRLITWSNSVDARNQSLEQAKGNLAKINIRKNGSCVILGKQVTEEQIEVWLTGEFEKKPDLKVLIRVDQETKHLFLSNVISICRKAGLPRASIAVKTERSSKGVGNSKPGPETHKDKLRLAFVTNGIADYWNIAKSGCLDAQRDLGVEVEVKMPPEFSVVLQKQIVEDLVAGGIDGIAISPLDAENQTAWLNEIAAQVPLITHDADAPESKRRVYLGMDNYKAGRMCGQLVKKALPNGGGVMLFVGRLGQDNAKYRRQGVIDELFGRSDPESHDKIAHDPVDGVLDGGKYKILGTLVDKLSLADAKQMATDAIAAHPEMKAMIGLFEYNLPACYQALKQAGKLGKIKLVGFDENDVTLQGIREGFVNGTIVQNPYQYGYQSVKVLKEIIEGKDNLNGRDYIDIVARKITKENVEVYWTDLKARKTEGQEEPALPMPKSNAPPQKLTPQEVVKVLNLWVGEWTSVDKATNELLEKFSLRLNKQGESIEGEGTLFENGTAGGRKLTFEMTYNPELNVFVQIIKPTNMPPLTRHFRWNFKKDTGIAEYVTPTPPKGIVPIATWKKTAPIRWTLSLWFTRTANSYPRSRQ